MYLMALPTNVPEKWGARLLEHLSGEAEELLEAVDIDDITKDQGWKLVLDTLDEKYKEASKDELQRVMKDYFYTICIKEQETYRYFITRLDTAYKALVRNGVELPDEVRGWMLLKKLALEPNSESMILTASQGSVKYVKIMQAVRNVFPHGKSLKTAKTKDIFVTEQEDYHRRGGTEGPPESDGEPLEVMETIATQLQEAEDYESEDALDTYETYTTVRKKMQEKKIIGVFMAADRISERSYRGPRAEDQVSPMPTKRALEERVSFEKQRQRSGERSASCGDCGQ